MKIRLGRPIAVHLQNYLMRHLAFFKQPLGIEEGFELLNFVLLYHPSVIAKILGDSDDALHFEKVKELTLAMRGVSEFAIPLP